MTKRRYPPLVLSANAAEGHGKTSFLLTSPPPLWIAHIDPNTEEIVEKAIALGEIDKGDVTLQAVPYPATVFNNRSAIQEDAERSWEDDFISPLKNALDDDGIRSIGLDTATELFELLLMADHGKTVQIMPEMRTKTNYRYKGLLQALKRSGKNIVLLHRVRDVWQTTVKETRAGQEESRDKVPGMYEREGFNKTGFHVNAECYLSFNPARGGTLYNQFGVRLSRCLQRPSLVTEQASEKKFWDLDDESWWWGREKIDGVRVKRASFDYLARRIFDE